MTNPSARLLSLLSLLQAGRDWPGERLAQRLEVSRRTVRRDVDRLREMGYRVSAVKGPHGGYRLEAGSELPPLLFDDDQAVALAVALRTAAASGADIEEAAARALVTVRQVMPQRLRHRLDVIDVTATAGAGTERAARVDPAVLSAVGSAVRMRETMRFDYGDVGAPTDEQRPRPPRRVQPHHVVVMTGRWYLVAWEPRRADWRIYRLDRMTPRVPTGPRFARREVPGGDVVAFVSARFKGSEASDVWPCVGEVVLAAPAASVSPFVGDGAVTDLGPDRCRIIEGSWSWASLAASFGRFDADIEVVGPPALKQAFAHLARRYWRADQPLSTPG